MFLVPFWKSFLGRFFVSLALQGDLVEAAFLKDVLAEIVILVVPGVPEPFRKPILKGSKNGPRKSNENVYFWGPFSATFLVSWAPFGPLLGHLLAVFPPLGPRSPQRRPKTGQDRPKTGPKRAQDGPKMGR